MGTSTEWIKVLEVGGFFGAVMLLVDALTQPKKVLTWPNILFTAIGSVVFGMAWVFAWRVLHRWIVVPFVIVTLGAFGAGIINRRARDRAKIR